MGKREGILLTAMPLIALYEVFVDPPYLDLLLLLSVIVLFKLFKIISTEEVRLIESFLPSKLKFIASLLKVIN